MLFDFEKFKKVCDYSWRSDKRETHLLDLNTPGGNDFLIFLEQHGIAITEYAKSIGYVCWNADDNICWGVHPKDAVGDAVTIYTAFDFSAATIQVDDGTMLDFLGV